MDTGSLCAAWTAAIAAFNDGDPSALAELLAPPCVFEHVGTSRDEIMAALARDRAAGWLRHEILSVTAVGTVLATTARNTFADGGVYHVAGVARFNDAGQVAYLAAVDVRAPLPGMAAPS